MTHTVGFATFSSEYSGGSCRLNSYAISFPTANKESQIMVTGRTLELRILKTILWVYIILALVLAGLNYGFVNRTSPEISSFINEFWHFYENWIKTFFIVIGSLLTLRIIGTKRSIMRKKNLIGFIVAALVLHIVGPLVLNNREVYFFAMPLPWTTTPLQLLYPDSSFYLSRFPIWGAAGISVILIFYICVSVVVLSGTLLFGRRWQCSTLCMFNGFAAEVFAPAIPLLGKSKKMKPTTVKVFSCLRWIFFAVAVFFTAWWILLLSGIPVAGDFQVMSRIEVYKYLSTELLMMLFFWVAFIGRGYCYYCPLGTLLALISRWVGQRIVTNKTQCVQCNRCNIACPMSIDIRGQAETGNAVRSLRCVGCGHCVDACPTKTLSYTTGFLSWLSRKQA